MRNLHSTYPTVFQEKKKDYRWVVFIARPPGIWITMSFVWKKITPQKSDLQSIDPGRLTAGTYSHHPLLSGKWSSKPPWLCSMLITCPQAPGTPKKKSLSARWWFQPNPFQKYAYACQIGSFPQGSGWKLKNIWNHHRNVWVLDSLSIQTRWRSISIINLSLFYFSTTTFSSLFWDHHVFRFLP